MIVPRHHDRLSAAQWSSKSASRRRRASEFQERFPAAIADPYSQPEPCFALREVHEWEMEYFITTGGDAIVLLFVPLWKKNDAKKDSFLIEISKEILVVPALTFSPSWRSPSFPSFPSWLSFPSSEN